jgi:hypothetical protein
MKILKKLEEFLNKIVQRVKQLTLKPEPSINQKAERIEKKIKKVKKAGFPKGKLAKGKEKTKESK